MNKTSMTTAAAVVVAAAVAAYFFLAPGRTGTHTGAGAPSQMAAASGGSSGAAAGAASGAASAPPVSVTVVRAAQRDVDVQLEATGTVTPVNSVDVRPQVSSVITKVHVREGQFVKAGELLFTLDTRTDAANVARAQAQLAKDQATLADAQRQLGRSRDLVAQNFVSQSAVDANVSLVDAQTAVLRSDNAAIESARVGLSYGRIVAASAGRVGAVNVFAGTSVQANTTTLATITQLDPIYVAFSLPQRNVSDALQSLKNGGSKVVASLPDSKSVLAGRLQFVDSAVDAGSGTVRVKAMFENRQQALWPGAFVVVKMTVQTLKNAVVVPQASVVQGARGRSVFVVEAGNKVAMRPVELLQPLGNEAVVSGVRVGERVIVDGRQNVRPGSTVVERAAEGSRAGGRGGAASAPAMAASSAGPGASGGSNSHNPAAQP